MKPPPAALVPFFVADRPASLRILRGVPMGNYDGPLGLMAHANTSENFQDLFRAFPCGPGLHVGPCDAACTRLKTNTIKMCDSGVFTKQGCPLDYEELFAIYQRMGVHYGIMIDVLGDAKRTIDSARRGLDVYRNGDYEFNFVGVAQGQTLRQHVECYSRLKQLGFEHVAVGGLLKKRKNTSHYAHVRADRLFATLEAIRERFPNDWLFALGCYHPSRHLRFQQLDLFGSDYKGWIFNYNPRHTKRGDGPARRARYRQVRTFLSNEVFSDTICLNGARAEIQEATMKGRILVIVSCGARKVWDDDPSRGAVRARNVYTGLFFRHNRAYAEKFADAWAILSAKHGLLAPHDLVRGNYDARFRSRSEALTTRVLREQILERGFHRFSRVVVLGGKQYGAAVAEAYAGTGIPVLRPLEEYGAIGYMTQAVKRAVESRTPLHD